MMQTILLKRLMTHISSLSLVLLIAAAYLFDNQDLLDPWLPLNGKPLAIFCVIAIVIVYELTVCGYQGVTKGLLDLSEKHHVILHQMEVNRLILAVNDIYARFTMSGDEFIDNEYSIKELNELKDMRDRLNVNSYTQGRLEYLCSKVKR